MNPVELLHCPVPAACQICGQEVTESMFAFGHRRGEYRCASEVRIFADETVEWDLRAHQPGTISHDTVELKSQRI